MLSSESTDVSSESEEDEYESALSNAMHTTTGLNNREAFNDSLMLDDSVEEVKIVGKDTVSDETLAIKEMSFDSSLKETAVLNPDIVDVEVTTNISNRNGQLIFITENLCPLEPLELRIVNNVLHRSGNDDDVIAQIGSETVNLVSLQRLKLGMWLVDELINSQMHLLNLKHLHDFKCHCFTSYFMSKLVDEDRDYDFLKVKRWFKDVNIFSYEEVIFPINFNDMHWV